jgi:hypothetical protein
MLNSVTSIAIVPKEYPVSDHPGDPNRIMDRNSELSTGLTQLWDASVDIAEKL